MKKAPLYFLLTSACLLTVSVAKWSRIAGTDKKPSNMCLMMAGTYVESSKGITPNGALILGDPMRPISIAGGKSEAVLKFAKQSFVERASFINDGLEGKVSASMSADGKAWNTATNVVFSGADRSVLLDMGRTPGRYLRMEFELVRGGTIRSFQAFGEYSESDYTLKQSEDGSGMSVNLASGVGGSRLIYVNPELYGSRNEAILYDKLEFPESDEKYRTAVYDFGQVRSLNEFGSVHSPRPVRLSVYAFETLPEKEDWRGRLSFDPTVFETTEPVAMGAETSGSGSLKVKPKKTVKARYVALRWEPDFNPPAFSVSGVSMSAGGFEQISNEVTGTETTGGGAETPTGDNTSIIVSVNPGTGFQNPFSFGTAGYAGRGGLPGQASNNINRGQPNNFQHNPIIPPMASP